MPPSAASSRVSASTMWPSRVARCQATPAASSERSQAASAPSIARDGGQVKPRGMLLAVGFTAPVRRARRVDPESAAATADAAATAAIATPASLAGMVRRDIAATITGAGRLAAMDLELLEALALSGDRSAALARFAILVCSDHAGAAIPEASPPAR